jgi:hypothetical protein
VGFVAGAGVTNTLGFLLYGVAGPTLSASLNLNASVVLRPGYTPAFAVSLTGTGGVGTGTQVFGITLASWSDPKVLTINWTIYSAGGISVAGPAATATSAPGATSQKSTVMNVGFAGKSWHQTLTFTQPGSVQDFALTLPAGIYEYVLSGTISSPFSATSIFDGVQFWGDDVAGSSWAANSGGPGPVGPIAGRLGILSAGQHILHVHMTGTGSADIWLGGSDSFPTVTSNDTIVRFQRAAPEDAMGVIIPPNSGGKYLTLTRISSTSSNVAAVTCPRSGPGWWCGNPDVSKADLAEMVSAKVPNNDTHLVLIEGRSDSSKNYDPVPLDNTAWNVTFIIRVQITDALPAGAQLTSMPF